MAEQLTTTCLYGCGSSMIEQIFHQAEKGKYCSKKNNAECHSYDPEEGKYHIYYVKYHNILLNTI